MVVLSSLPLEAMNPKRLQSMAKRCIQDESKRKQFLEQINVSRKLLDEFLAKNDVAFLMYKYERNDPCIFVETPLLSKVSNIEYVAGEWESHFDDTSAYFERRHIHFTQTTDELTRNTNVLAFENSVYVTVNLLTQKTFMFSQPEMVKSITTLFKRLGESVS